jgi:hypothetical protein
MPATISGETYVVMNPAALAELLRGPSGPVVKYVFRQGEKVKIEAITIAPKRTGNLAAHIVKRIVNIGGEPVCVVGIDGKVVPYAYWVHEGSAPHWIFPREADRLVFFSQKAGRVIFMPPGEPVFHPGTKPNRFLVRALHALDR